MTEKEIVWIGSVAHEHLGPVWVALSGRGVVAVVLRGTEAAMRAQLARQRPDAAVVVDPGRVESARTQLRQYLGRERRDFDLPIAWDTLTPFQQDVLRQVCAIPYGQTRTYGEIATQSGKPLTAARAVGQANATNPMPIIIPCHRVLGSDGGLHGYGGAGGVETKAWLLRLEGSRLL